MFKFIEEANELFPQKPYEFGAKNLEKSLQNILKVWNFKRTKDISVINDFFLCDGRKIKTRIYTPNSKKVSSSGLIYIHGGGWVMGDLDSHDKVCVDLSINCEYECVISIDYSLSPENPYPVAFKPMLFFLFTISKWI